ncbi:arylsulfatase [uncultured Lutibacter sp.]|uniref:arylsulfatase n=1 Tax=uncultured Lutibacter sp. TaxID=437739 RepID=UPI00262AFC31|nr:arylsulfatase [uncultured Lutibacter sp.]
MQSLQKIVFILILALNFNSCKELPNKDEVKNPNIIYILADDLGYGELGVYGQEKIQTPNIDALASSGMIFTQHYAGAPVCAPSRYMLLTGKHAGHARIRGNDEWAERGDVWNYKKTVEDPNLEGQRPILNSTTTLGKVLQKAGYKTAVVGKWGLGAPLTEGIPTKSGFDFFYGYNCQRQAHQLYPKHLWKNEEKVWLANELIAPNTKLDKGADIMASESYQKYEQHEYAPALMQQEVLQFIEENKEQPFFMYYASPLPHLPLQVPHQYVDKYVKLFGEEAPYVGDKGYFPTRYPNATYAGMITYLDDQVGEIVQKLKDLDLYENTIIVFTSDNGPTYTGGVDAEYFNSAKPFSNEYGRTKGFTYEGGIRVPMIASWPGKIKAGSTTNHVSAFWDVLPTFGSLVNAELPKDIDGISFLPTLLEKGDQPTHQFLYWEFPSYQGQQAVRMGDWKGIRKNIFKGNMDIELYNLKEDPTEAINVADEYPEIVEKITTIMKEEHTPADIEKFKIKELGDEISK